MIEGSCDSCDWTENYSHTVSILKITVTTPLTFLPRHTQNLACQWHTLVIMVVQDKVGLVSGSVILVFVCVNGERM